MKLSSLADPVTRRVKDAIKSMGLKETALRLSYRRGIAPGLDPETLRRIVFEISGSRLKSVTYRQMSGWKKSGAYRLLVRTDANTKLALVYKNALYSHDEIPALAGLPITPGLGEYVFFKHSVGGAAKYLPQVFLAEEREQGRHYEYVMEDLTEAYRPLTGHQDRISLCRALPDVHDSFRSFASHPEFGKLLRFDRDFSERLLAYSRNSLEGNQKMQATAAIDALLDDWTNFAAVFRAGAAAVARAEPLVLVHGDCNLSNAMCSKDTGGFMLLDLEWAGWGLPHQDLVSALKGAPTELEARCLEEFSRRRGAGRLDRDWNIFRYCAIQRALLDAGFIGIQVLDAKARTPKWFPDFIDGSCVKALELSRLLEVGRI